jgi:hypothetical protein
MNRWFSINERPAYILFALKITAMIIAFHIFCLYEEVLIHYIDPFVKGSERSITTYRPYYYE